MHRPWRLRQAAFAWFGLSVTFAIAPPAWAGLQEFVARPDASYSFREDRSWSEPGLSMHELKLSSQTFQGEVWHHTLLLVKPTDLAVKDHVLMLIGGGQHGPAPALAPPTPAAVLATVAALARKSHMLVACMQQVPDQPLLGGKLEDQAIAYTLTQYFRTANPDWPLLEPMVKSVVRAMDATQAFAQARWGLPLRGFTLSGESKRGWTTWLTAAVDPRVEALVPIVFDIVHIAAQLPHQLASWGRYSDELGDYAEQGLPAMLASPSGQKLLAIIDPYAYRAALRQPKLIVLGTNDHYWPLDAARLYFAELAGPKYLLYIPNTGHDDTAEQPDVQAGRVALALAAAGKLRLPQIATSATPATQGGGAAHIDFQADTLPTRLQLWSAESATQDFRAAVWHLVRELPAQLHTQLDGPPPSQPARFRASFIAAKFTLSGQPFAVTSPVLIRNER